MNQFSIRDIENLCGIRAHTLRIWEQRYSLFVPKRKVSQHRFYDSDDLKELLRISFLYHNGYKISRIARLSRIEIQEEVTKIKPAGCSYEGFIHQLIEASIVLDKESFDKIINALVSRIGLEKCILHVFYPFLQRIGLLWMTNHVIPAQEHFSSHILRKKIICATDCLEVNTGSSGNIIIFAPAGEYHEIPLLAANYFFRKYNNPTTYFGVNVSLEALKYYVRHYPCTHLYAHVVTNLCHTGLNEFILSLCRSFPALKIIISGPAWQSVERRPINLITLTSVQEIIDFARERAQSS